MALRKAWLTAENITKVLKRYRELDCPTLQQMAVEFDTSPHTVGYIVRHNIPPAEYKSLSRLRYSRSKLGHRNPMKGKKGELHHNYIGEVNDGYGYLTCLRDGKRMFVHRLVVMDSLGLKE